MPPRVPCQSESILSETIKSLDSEFPASPKTGFTEQETAAQGICLNEIFQEYRDRLGGSRAADLQTRFQHAQPDYPQKKSELSPLGL